MHPVLLEDSWIGAINSYGTLILIAGWSITPGVVWDARQRGFRSPWEFFLDFALVLIAGCLFGGRFVYVLTNPGTFIADPSLMLSLDEGFVFYGSVLGVLFGFIWLARRHDLRLGTVCDVLATWMALSHAIGRTGCLLAGCCWGAPCIPEHALSVRFPPESIVYRAAEGLRDGAHTLALHPVQAYESLGLLCLFAILLGFRIRRGPEARWVQAARWAVGYGVLRIVTELFRGDPGRGYLLEIEWPGLATAIGLAPDKPVLLATSQVIGAVMIALGLWFLRRVRRRAGPGAADAEP